MSSAILVCTHGYTSKYLIQTAEMIVGPQENIGFINFIDGDSTLDLKRKYQKEIQELDCSKGLLIMVDLFGGTPFNTIGILAYGNMNMEVITGVNIPMLVETFLSRELLDLRELLVHAETAGRNGITFLEKSIIQEAESEMGDEL